MNNIEKKYYLSPIEFSVIMAGHGVSRVFGLDTIDGRIGNKEICVALHNMYKNQLIENAGDVGFTTDKELADIINTIKMSRKELVIKFQSERESYNICGFVAEQISVIEEHSVNCEKLVMFEASLDEFIEEISSLGINSDVSISILDTKGGMAIKKENISFEISSEDRIDKMRKICKEAML